MNAQTKQKLLTGGAMAGFLFVSFVVGVMFFGAGNVTGANKDAAEKEAREYAKALGLNIQGAVCARNDSDGDGYVSCSLAIKQVSGDVQIEPIECAIALTSNTGCRAQKPVMRR